MRRPLIAGNWKMHKTVAEATALVNHLLAMDDLYSDDVEAIVCPPFTAIPAVSKLLGDQRKLGLGAQTMHDQPSGAFTGEISAPMLIEHGVRYVIIGHSERRAYAAETDETVNRKVKAAIESGITPIVAVGETHIEHVAGKTIPLVTAQVRGAFAGIAEQAIERCVLAYEPVWAIGTGLACDPREADAVMGEIRATLPALRDVRILYGGSVNPENIAAFVKTPNVDGALVGGASLSALSFAALIKESRNVVEAR
ncbi:MAG TPA: triose-phosphate isomerase [Candidatus Binatia bacterium]|nr:triose-phosphate isomerase [Candidatus Binatia bacterium]